MVAEYLSHDAKRPDYHHLTERLSGARSKAMKNKDLHVHADEYTVTTASVSEWTEGEASTDSIAFEEETRARAFVYCTSVLQPRGASEIVHFHTLMA